ncbi:Peroxin 12 (Pex12), putative [Acanthamoeba castellanii str. Neff]|uniref:Peroxisome assembly protein, putative n=1 Tax=Acanthamoeba castellanii (strain ATCC 30010 / Neff) TaxID=1257118 RepID=L8GMZ9_ACACF|nr:Peroxin 12 (Pex12), putative [Acanthamoeba castellanii str. Neff]ELR14455.1 Peroxisome assembly protein, putative [Acanthamoeba castellanii str. Neff]
MFMANFSSGEAQRPSFFEMVAQQELLPFFGPALKYALSVAAVRWPRLEWGVTHHDELFYGLRLLLEAHHLRRHDASFSEHFYSLKRVRVAAPTTGAPDSGASPSPATAGSRLTDHDRRVSLLLLVGLPYVKAKLDQLHKRMAGPLSGWLETEGSDDDEGDDGDGEGDEGTAGEDGGRRARWWRRWRRVVRVARGLFVAGYPWASAVYEGLFFVYQVLYLYDHTRYYTPFLHLQRLQVQRLSLEDTIEMTQDTARRRAAGAESWGVGDARGAAAVVRTVGRVLARAWHVVEDYSALALPLVLFVFKFLEWWYAENTKQTAPALPTPPPPRPPPVVEEAGRKKADGECGLCGKRRTNPAMVAGTGYVFCYPCLHASVTTHGRCPATGLPASPDSLLKLYEST